MKIHLIDDIKCCIHKKKLHLCVDGYIFVQMENASKNYSRIFKAIDKHI